MEILGYKFMQHALLAGFLGGVACSIVGVLVISMQLSFIGVSISHAAFAGAIISIFVGINPLWGAFIFSLVSAAVIGPLADRGEFNPDTSLGIVFSLMLGLSFLFMGLIPGPKSQALELMWGSILTVNSNDLIVLTVTAVLAVGVVLLFYKEIQAIVFNREVALSIGLHASWIFYGVLLLTGMTVAACLRPVGGLLIFSLILNPAAAAFQLTYNLKRLFLLAIFWGVLSCWAGLGLSYIFNLPSGATIVVLSTLIFLIVNAFSPKRKVKSVNKTEVEEIET